MKNTYMRSDLIDLLYKLELISDPTLHPVIKHRYRNRKHWSKFYENCRNKRYT